MTTRRSFLKKASIASAPFILPSHIWSAKGDTSPNNRINIAIIGPGKWGVVMPTNSFVTHVLK